MIQSFREFSQRTFAAPPLFASTWLALIDALRQELFFRQAGTLREDSAQRI